MAGQVVETLMVELDGRTIQLEAKIAQMEARLKQFEGRATQASAAPAAAAANLGQRYANAGRAIAMAGEQAARTGKLAGEAGRQMLSQGANMALFFGPAGAITGGVAIATLAIVELFRRSREEMAETARAFRADLADIVRASDLRKLAGSGGLLQTLFSGDPQALLEGKRKDESDDEFLVRSRGIQGIQRAIDALKKIKEAGVSASGETLRSAQEAEEAIKRLTKLLGDPRDPTTLLGKYALAGGQLDPLTRSAVQETARGVRDDEIKSAQKLAQEQEALRRGAQDALARLTKTLTDDLTLELDRLKRLVAEKFGAAVPEEIKRQLDAMEANIGAVGFFEVLDDSLADAESRMETALGQMQLGSSELAIELHRQLQLMADATEQQMIGVDVALEEYKKLEDRLKKIRDLQIKVAAGIADAGAGDPKPEADTSVRDAIEMGRQVEAAARGALQLAEAFGIVDENTSSVLQNIVQIAANIPALSEVLGADKLDVGKLAATALPVLGGIAGLVSQIFGDSPAEQQRRQTLEANSKAIRELTSKVGLLGEALDISGTDLTAADPALAALFAELDRYEQLAGRTTGTFLIPRDFTQSAFDALPAEMRDLIQRIADELNVELNGTEESFRQLQQAIDQARAKMTEFGEDFDSVLAQLDFESAIFGDKGPLDRLKKLLETFGSAAATGVPGGLARRAGLGAVSPAIAQILAAGDPNTPEGRAAIRAMIQQFAALMAGGGGILDASLLGDLNSDEFRRLLVDLIEQLNALDGETGSTQGSSINRSITEVTGSRLEARLANIQVFDERTAIAAEAIAAMLSGISPIAAPALSLVSGSGPGGGVAIGDIFIESISIILPDGVSPDPGVLTQEIGGQLAAAIRRAVEDPRILERIDQGLGARRLDRARKLGNNRFKGGRR